LIIKNYLKEFCKKNKVIYYTVFDRHSDNYIESKGSLKRIYLIL